MFCPMTKTPNLPRLDPLRAIWTLSISCCAAAKLWFHAKTSLLVHWRLRCQPDWGGVCGVFDFVENTTHPIRGGVEGLLPLKLPMRFAAFFCLSVDSCDHAKNPRWHCSAEYIVSSICANGQSPGNRKVANPLASNGNPAADNVALDSDSAVALLPGSKDSPTIAEMVAQILEQHPRAKRLLLVIDQFEELYTLCNDVALRRRFLDELLTALPLHPDSSPDTTPLTSSRQPGCLAACLPWIRQHRLSRLRWRITCWLKAAAKGAGPCARRGYCSRQRHVQACHRA